MNDQLKKDFRELQMAANIADTFHGRNCCAALDRIEAAVNGVGVPDSYVLVPKSTVWAAWRELDAIRARSGVPLDFDGRPQCISEEYFSGLVDKLGGLLGEDRKPWAPAPQVNAEGVDIPKGFRMSPEQNIVWDWAAAHGITLLADDCNDLLWRLSRYYTARN